MWHRHSRLLNRPLPTTCCLMGTRELAWLRFHGSNIYAWLLDYWSSIPLWDLLRLCAELSVDLVRQIFGEYRTERTRGTSAEPRLERDLAQEDEHQLELLGAALRTAAYAGVSEA